MAMFCVLWFRRLDCAQERRGQVPCPCLCACTCAACSCASSLQLLDSCFCSALGLFVLLSRADQGGLPPCVSLSILLGFIAGTGPTGVPTNSYCLQLC
jgi:hypothetical protein